MDFAAQNKFCAVFGIKPMNKAEYIYIRKNRIIDVMVDSADTILCKTVARVVEAYNESEIDADFNGNITVSFDGSWHKRIFLMEGKPYRLLCQLHWFLKCHGG